MEQIGKIIPQASQQLQKVPERNNSLAVLKTISVSANDEEKRIIALKYQSKQFGAMTDIELLPVAKKLILQIHVITGWTVPENEVVNILVDEFTKKLREDYPNMNPDEITYAFRQDTQVQDWGKAMNLSLIDQVLLPYLTKRKQVSHEVEERAKPVEQKIYTEEELLEIQRLSAAQFYQRLRKGRIEKVPDDVRNILITDKRISNPEEADGYFINLLGSGIKAIYYEPE